MFLLRDVFNYQLLYRSILFLSYFATQHIGTSPKKAPQGHHQTPFIRLLMVHNALHDNRYFWYIKWYVMSALDDALNAVQCSADVCERLCVRCADLELGVPYPILCPVDMRSYLVSLVYLPLSDLIKHHCRQ